MDAHGCRRCGSAGHWADLCPHNARARNRREHLDRIAGYVELMQAGDITPREKQHMIKAENESWYGKDIPAALNR